MVLYFNYDDNIYLHADSEITRYILILAVFVNKENQPQTTEELLEEERQRRAEQEAQTANVQSQLAGFGNTTSPAATAPKQAVESPMLESEPLVDPNILSDFVGAAKEKWQNRKNTQINPVETLVNPNPDVSTIGQEKRLVPQKQEVDLENNSIMDTSDKVLQASVQKSNLKEYLSDSLSRLTDSLNIKKKWNNFQETGFNKNNHMNLNEELQGFLYENVARPFLPMSSKGVVNAMQNFKLARKDKNINIYDNVEALKNEELISELMNIKDYANNPILEYSHNANESKNFSNSPEIKNYVQKNYDKIIAGEMGPEVIEFMSNTKDKNLSDLANKFNPRARDRAYFLQHATVLNPKIDEYGNFTCDLADAYDFKKRPDTIPNIPNNWGFTQQEKGNLDNYSTLFHIDKEFKKYSKKDKRWRRKKHI